MLALPEVAGRGPVPAAQVDLDSKPVWWGAAVDSIAKVDSAAILVPDDFTRALGALGE